jgi:hypothetical protein
MIDRGSGLSSNQRDRFIRRSTVCGPDDTGAYVIMIREVHVVIIYLVLTCHSQLWGGGGGDGVIITGVETYECRHIYRPSFHNFTRASSCPERRVSTTPGAA